MFAENKPRSQLKRYYRIIVEGRIDPSWSKWLDNFRLDPQIEGNNKYLTTISGVVADQAALRGVLNRLWDLNLVLRSIQQVDPTDIIEKK
jgi:hypothetical protein